MKLARLGQLTLAPDRGIQTTKVRQGGGVREPVQDLGDSGLSFHEFPLIVGPVPRGQGVLKSAGNNSRVKDGAEIDVVLLFQLLLDLPGNVLLQLAVKAPEEVREQRPSEIEPLLAVMITIVGLPPAKHDQQQTVNLMGGIG